LQQEVYAMSKESLEELLVAAGRLSIDEQRILLKELLRNSPDYQPLSRIAQERQQFDQAVEYFNKALVIFEKLQLELDVLEPDHQLDKTAAVKLNNEAMEYYNKASEKPGSERNALSESVASNHPPLHTSVDLDPVEKTRGSMGGLDRETIIWLAEDEELCGY
jgi:tetratricopeptide (TPR) repeat protein